MTATPISSVVRYALFGTREYVMVPTIAAATLIPTRAEIDAGTDLTPEVAAVEGFNVTGEDLETPDMASDFTPKIPGRTTVEDSSITLYADQDSDDVRTLFTRGQQTNIVIFPEGDDEGVDLHKMDIFQVRVKSVGKPNEMEEAGRITTMFSITKKPVENIAVPTSP
ncbi:MAG: hypothetical protein ACRDYU_07450 [Actinomycetes bacterium]